MSVKAELRAASPAMICKLYSIPPHSLRNAILRGELCSHAVSRRSLLMCHEVEQWIVSHPQTKSPRKPEVTP
jgi:hypothetical protein